MNVCELTRAAIDLLRQRPRDNDPTAIRPPACIHQAIVRAANLHDASEEVAAQALELANLHASLTRFRAQLQADELLAQLNEAADEIDQLKGERLPVRREQDHGAN